MNDRFTIHPIGKIIKQDDKVLLEVSPEHKPALLGLDQFSHVVVFFWFDRNDDPETRAIQQLYPRKDQRNPLSGVFATHAPMRPNLIGMTICKMVNVQDTTIEIETIDALDQTPLIDLKPYIPDPDLIDIKLPSWV